MRQITNEELFCFYKKAFDHCGQFLLQLSDEQIGTYIFEEFDIDATTFLHQINLDKLKTDGFIGETEYDLSLKLRQKFMDLSGTALWNVESVKKAEEWLEIMRLADSIKSRLK